MPMKKAYRPHESQFYEYTYLKGLGPFRKYGNNPILAPQGDGWKSHAVFNPAAWTEGKRSTCCTEPKEDVTFRAGVLLSYRARNQHRRL